MLPSVRELQLSPGSTRSSLSPEYVWAYYFKHVLYIRFMANPFTIAVIKDDSGAMVLRSYIEIFCVLNALSIVPSEKAHKLLLCLPACATFLHLLHKTGQSDVE